MTTPQADKPREKLELSKEDAKGLTWGDTPDDIRVISDEIKDNGRWSIYHYIIIQRISDGKFFGDSYSVGATEQQDERPWEYDEPNFTEVFPVEKTVIVYE